MAKRKPVGRKSPEGQALLKKRREELASNKPMKELSTTIKPPKNTLGGAKKLAINNENAGGKKPLDKETKIMRNKKAGVRAKKQSFGEKVSNVLSGRPIEIGGREFPTGARGSKEDELSGAAPKVLGGSVPIAPAGKAIELAQGASQTFNRVGFDPWGKISQEIASVLGKIGSNRRLLGSIGVGLSGTSGMMTWLASDNMLGGISIYNRDIRDAVKWDGMDVDVAREKMEESKANAIKTQDFIKSQTILNPALWPFRKLINANVEQALLSIDENIAALDRVGGE